MSLSKVAICLLSLMGCQPVFDSSIELTDAEANALLARPARVDQIFCGADLDVVLHDENTVLAWYVLLPEPPAYSFGFRTRSSQDMDSDVDTLTYLFKRSGDDQPWTYAYGNDDLDEDTSHSGVASGPITQGTQYRIQVSARNITASTRFIATLDCAGTRAR